MLGNEMIGKEYRSKNGLITFSNRYKDGKVTVLVGDRRMADVDVEEFCNMATKFRDVWDEVERRTAEIPGGFLAEKKEVKNEKRRQKKD